ncbi:MAG: ArsA family ATPase [Archangium sp.]|nr:ArsA family ATPase [Archangium sp.]
MSTLLDGHDVLLVVGAGGVGKTTIAATLGLRSAMRGESTLVCTIDPAKRLANALGLQTFANAETRVGDEIFARAGLAPGAPLYAMMLDMKHTWDALVERHAPPDKRDAILRNRFYQALSGRLAGSQEYIAMEKLWELSTRRRTQRIVLDTPPAAHALDFLDAPNRLLDFLDNDAAKWLLAPALQAGRVGLSFLSWGGGYLAKTLSRFTGAETLQQLTDFMLAMSGMNEGFRERAHQTRALLQAPTTAFVVVTAPMPERLSEAIAFHTTLRQNKLHVAAVVCNRVQPPVAPELWAAAARLPDALRAPVEATLGENERLATRDAKAVAMLRTACAPTPVIEVPLFERDVHDLAGMWDTSRHLFGEAGSSGQDARRPGR